MSGEPLVTEEQVFSFDMHLAAVIAEGCDLLAKRGIGHPHEFDADSPGWSREGQDAWEAVLRDIASGFRAYSRNAEPTPEFERAFDLLRKWWGALWD